MRPTPADTEDPRPPDVDDRRRSERIAWSLAIALAANVIVGAIALLSTSPRVGIMACTTLALLSCILVAAETLTRVQRREYRTEDVFSDSDE